MSEVKTHKKSLLRAEDRRRLNCKYCETSGADQKIYTGVESLLQHCQREHPNQDVLHGSINEEPALLVACSYCEQEFGSLKSYTNHRAKNYDPKCKAASPVEVENPFYNISLAPLTMPSRSRNTPRLPRTKRAAPPPPPPLLPDEELQLGPVFSEANELEDCECTELADALVRMSDPDFSDARDNTATPSPPPCSSDRAAVVDEHVAKKVRFSLPPTKSVIAGAPDASGPPPLKPIQAMPRTTTAAAVAVVAAKKPSAVAQTGDKEVADAVQLTTGSKSISLMEALSEYAGDDLPKWTACLKMVGITDLSQALQMEYGFKRLLLSGSSCSEYAPIINAISELRIRKQDEEIAALRRGRPSAIKKT